MTANAIDDSAASQLCEGPKMVGGRSGMRVVVHIGTGKAGSTSIQQWLKANRQKLRANGVYPSDLFMDFDTRKIAMYAAELSVQDTSFALFGIETAEQHAALREQIVTELRDDIARARAARCETYVISSEYLSSRLRTDAAVDRLRALLDAHADEVRILCFLRPQVDLLVSRLSTQARVSKVNPLLIHCRSTHPMVDYLALYQRWSRAFPNGARFIPYKRSPSVITDLCRELGVDPEQFHNTPSRNTRVDYRAARINHNINSRDRVGNIQTRHLRFFMQDLRCEQPLTIARLTAWLVHGKYILRNRKLEKLSNGQITAADLTPRFRAYPLRGNVLRAIRPFDGAPLLREIFTRFNAQLWFERARSRAAEAELAQLRDEPSKAETLGRKGLEFLDMASNAGMGVSAAELDRLRQRLRTLAPERD